LINPPFPLLVGSVLRVIKVLQHLPKREAQWHGVLVLDENATALDQNGPPRQLKLSVAIVCRRANHEGLKCVKAYRFTRSFITGKGLG